MPEVDGEISVSGDSPEEDSDTGDWENGSQWESPTEGDRSLHSHDEAPRVNRISIADILSESEGDDVAYVRVVRAKVVSSPENPSRAAWHPKIDRPQRSKAFESCLAAYVEINGMDAFTLFDSGSSADTISPDFVRVGDVRIHTLDKLVPLQLGMVGSRVSINCGTWTSIALGDRKEDRYYLDVVNIGRYDAILGAPFMRRFGIRLDFTSNSVVVGDTAIEALLTWEEAALLEGRDTRQGNGERGQQIWLRLGAAVNKSLVQPVHMTDSGSRCGDPGWISLGEGDPAWLATLKPVMGNGVDEQDGYPDQTKLTESDIPRLRREWTQTCEDLFANQPDELPPLREINHKIPSTDESKTHHHRQPKRPDAFKPALMAKIERYTRAKWWIPVTASRATPMMCIPKSAKNLDELRTVFDLREQNTNTHKDLTPMPDQDAIRHAVARAQYRSKCDISNAYELIRVEPGDVWKTAFATIAGTFVSNVMQQGDCNAPSIFQRFITHLIRDFHTRDTLSR